MNSIKFRAQLKSMQEKQCKLLRKKNSVDVSFYNGIYDRFKNPVVTAAHAPLEWRYDLNPKTNPFLMERLGINATLNAGAIEFGGKVCLVVRVEGNDRKSFFAIAESKNGIDNFVFQPEPILLDETSNPDTNVYDMRLVKHEDGWIYGLFCTERKDSAAPAGDTSSAVAACGLARTTNLKKWERLPDLESPSPQQRNVVLHPEFIDGKYGLYTRPQDGFITTGKGGGIGWALSKSMLNAKVGKEKVIEPKEYHTIKELKNGAGAAPIKTKKGWLHIAHGVRGCASGLRYVIYAFLCDLKKPWEVTHRPGGYLIAPYEGEYIGDVMNVVFTNGLVTRKNGEVLIYYASSDTRTHVARSSVDQLVDYCLNTPEDPLRSRACVEQRIKLIQKNRRFLKKK